MFLLDSNVFIFAKRDYYPLERVPEYWDWLLHQAECGVVKVPPQIWEEMQEHDDDLRTWLRQNKDELVVDNDEIDLHVADVLARYAPDLRESELEQIGADPFLIASAIVLGGTVVSKEVRRPSAIRANRKVPDICSELGIRCINDHTLIRELDFKTNWRRVPA